MNSLFYQTMIEELAAADSVECVHAICSRICREFGFDFFLYAARTPTSLINPALTVISGFPAPWWEHYKQQDYVRVDPVLAYCSTHITPLDWGTLRPQNPLAKTFLREAQDFGLHHGISFPVHSAKGDSALWSLVTNRPTAETAARIREVTPQACLLAVYLHEAVRRIIQIEEIPTATQQLSAREKECLLWAAEGKTSWETSKILGIAERTVIFHLQNAATKLNTTSRPQTIARAISTGQLLPQI